jgi:hypothetical protein
MDLLTCGPAAELTLALLVWWLLPRRFLYAHRNANPRKTIREIRKNSYTERGRPVEIHRFLTRAKELFLGNLDNL